MAVQGLRVARKGAEYIGTMEVQEKHRFDERSLARFMAAHVEGFVPPVKAEQFKGGQSNPTYRLTDGAGRRYVLRRKPWTANSGSSPPSTRPTCRRPGPTRSARTTAWSAPPSTSWNIATAGCC